MEEIGFVTPNPPVAYVLWHVYREWDDPLQTKSTFAYITVCSYNKTHYAIKLLALYMIRLIVT